MGLDNMPHVYPCKNQGTAVVNKKEVEYEGENGEMTPTDPQLTESLLGTTKNKHEINQINKIKQTRQVNKICKIN